MSPARFGRYEVRRPLGRGGMGMVYEGHDPQIDRAVAIKTIALQALDANEAAEFEARFRSEMRSAGRLQHHNIVALYDTGREDGTAYIVMELVRGQDLRQRLASGNRPSAAEAVALVLQLLAALEYAHSQQVVHRDIKPANLMLQADGVLKLCDFGVARLADPDATRTRGLIVGTARYASPEQIAGREVDARSDLYAAGVVLFELLTGKPPFDGANELETIARIGREPTPRPSAANPALPAALDAVVLRALAKDPARRFASAAEFAAALRSAATSLSAPAQPAPRRRTWIAVAVVIPVVLAAGYAWRPRAPAPPLAQAPQAPATGSAPTATPTPAAAPSPTPEPAPSPTPAPAPASAAASASDVAPPKPKPKPPPPPRLDGNWTGMYSCGELLNSTLKGPIAEPFSAQIALEIAAGRITWSRKGKTMSETVAGSIDANGRFSAEGEGSDNSPKVNSRWTVQASGNYNTRVKPARLDGTLKIVRVKDGSLARNCTMSAVPR